MSIAELRETLKSYNSLRGAKTPLRIRGEVLQALLDVAEAAEKVIDTEVKARGGLIGDHWYALDERLARLGGDEAMTEQDALARVKEYAEWQDHANIARDLRALVREVEAGRALLAAWKGYASFDAAHGGVAFLTVQKLAEAYDAARRGE